MAEKIERVYTINLRKVQAAPRTIRAHKAVILIRSFLEKHMKGDVVIGQALNEHVWAQSIKNPPLRVKVKAVKEGSVVKADLLETKEKRLRSTKNQKKEAEKSA